MGSVGPVKVEGAELLMVELPLVTPFRTSYATSVVERKLLVRLRTDAGTGWGECGAPAEPLYTSEYGDAARHVLVHHLLPRLAEAGEVTPDDVATALAPVQGHRMAKAACWRWRCSMPGAGSTADRWRRCSARPDPPCPPGWPSA